MTRYLVMRHAQTAWNEAGLFQGQRDIPLSATGLAQAARWAEALATALPPCAAILCSDLQRARQTAAILNETFKLPIQYDARLREMDCGQWVGRSLDELRRAPAYARQLERGWKYRPPGGESRREVLRRAVAAFLDLAPAYGGQRVLVVCHQGVVHGLRHHLGGSLYYPHNYNLMQGHGVQEVVAEAGRLRLGELFMDLQ